MVAITATSHDGDVQANNKYNVNATPYGPFVRGTYQSPVTFLYKVPVMRKLFITSQ